MRVMSSESNNKHREKKETKEDGDDLVDYKFSQISKAIAKRRELSQTFNRFKSNKKFDLTATERGLVKYIPYKKITQNLILIHVTFCIHRWFNCFIYGCII